MGILRSKSTHIHPTKLEALALLPIMGRTKVRRDEQANGITESYDRGISETGRAGTINHETIATFRHANGYREMAGNKERRVRLTDDEH